MKKGVKIVGIGCLGLIGLFILIALFIAVFGGDDVEDGYPLDIITGEEVLIYEIRLEISKSALDGSGEITSTKCEELKNIVYKYNPEADWFKYCSGTFYVDTPDTDKTEKIQLSTDGRCAILTFVEDEDDVTRLIDYEFKEEHCKGYRMFIDFP